MNSPPILGFQFSGWIGAFTGGTVGFDPWTYFTDQQKDFSDTLPPTIPWKCTDPHKPTLVGGGGGARGKYIIYRHIYIYIHTYIHQQTNLRICNICIYIYIYTHTCEGGHPGLRIGAQVYFLASRRVRASSAGHTVDGRNPAPPMKPWNDDSPVNTNK